MASTDSPQWFTAAVTNSSSSSYYLVNKNRSLDYPDSSSTSLAKMVDVHPPTTTKASKRSKNKRPVQFDDRAEACVVHQLEPCDEDPSSLWFSKQEIQDLREEGRQTLTKVKEAGGDLSALDEALGESIRGLEHGLSVYDYDSGCWNGAISAMEDINRNERRKNIVNTILAQQEEQREMGIRDPKGLKQCSMACTQWAHDRALDQAQKDFDDAVKVWREDLECAKLLPDILSRKHGKRAGTRRVSLLSISGRAVPSPAAPEERKATLESITKTVASALEELDDLEF